MTDRHEIYVGDCLDHLEFIPDNSIDSIVTDPPYGLSFMGKRWDYDVPSEAIWRECLRVLKPGGHLLAFAGTRTQHRMAVRIEDAGFEIRDMIAWVYGSGFPKSMDVSKAIDKAARGVPQGGVDPTSVNHGKFKGGCTEDNPGGRGFGAGPGAYMKHAGEKVERGLVPEAKQWDGWGTALKPALEPITVARKPLIGTVADNVLTHGTGAINVDGCRVGYLSDERVQTFWNNRGGATISAAEGVGTKPRIGEDAYDPSKGRWPANLIHDGSDDVLQAFPDAPGQMADASATAPSPRTSNVYGAMRRDGEPSRNSDNQGSVGFKMKPGARRLDAGSAARFFYCAKAGKSDRGEGNNHPTVKPTDLMRYLCRLVTPPGGLVLDPFMGSGSTGKAAVLEGFRFIGIDREVAYAQIARARIAAAWAEYNEL